MLSLVNPLFDRSVDHRRRRNPHAIAAGRIFTADGPAPYKRRLTEENENAATVGQSAARFRCPEEAISECDAPLECLLEFVLDSRRIGIATFPELFDESRAVAARVQ